MDSYGDAFSLGVKSIDDQHRQLAVLLDEFADCIKNNNEPDRLRQVVGEALALANEHFEHEEELMKAHSYPDIEEEKRNHRNLRLQLTTLVGDTLTVPGTSVTQENLAKMQRLLLEHITGPDRELVRFLITKGVH